MRLMGMSLVLLAFGHELKYDVAKGKIMNVWNVCTVFHGNPRNS